MDEQWKRRVAQEELNLVTDRAPRYINDPETFMPVAIATVSPKSHSTSIFRQTGASITKTGFADLPARQLTPRTPRTSTARVPTASAENRHGIDMPSSPRVQTPRTAATPRTAHSRLSGDIPRLDTAASQSVRHKFEALQAVLREEITKRVEAERELLRLREERARR
eukprot:GILJ01002721.1.p1 GENE.GILJ01002721.1~~GILJ01002721.1.p1  ORF type:complete len:190 (+),score=13.22 GILJ01002721.1:72-572(+)